MFDCTIIWKDSAGKEHTDIVSGDTVELILAALEIMGCEVLLTIAHDPSDTEEG